MPLGAEDPRVPPPSGSPSPGRAPPCGTSVPEPVLPLAFGPRQEERSAEQSGSRETENQGRAAGATAHIDGPTGRRAHRTPAASAPWPATRPGSLPGSLPGSGTGADLGPAHDLLPRSAFSSESKPRSLRLSSPPRPPVRARGPGLWRWPGAGPGQGANPAAAAATMLGRARARASSLCPPAPCRSGPPPENFRDGVLLTKHSGLF